MTSSTPSARSMSPPSVWLYGALAVAAAVPLYVARTAIGNRRVGDRSRPSLDPRRNVAVLPADGAASSGVANHVRQAGMLEQWYLSQPTGEKRAFTEGIRLKGPRPTMHQLQCALSRVALAHPTLLILPSPARDEVASQVTDADVAPDGTLAFPLTCVMECIESVSGPVEPILHRLVNQPSEEDLTPEEWSERHARGTTWRGVKLILVDEQNDAGADEFVLIVRLAHIVGDGISGLTVLRHVLIELAAMSAPDAPQQPTRIPATELRSIAAYPTMDDLLDYRPSIARIVSDAWTATKKRFQTASQKCAAAIWVGRNLVEQPDEVVPRGTTEFLPFDLDRPTLARLAREASAHGVTVQAVLSVASAFAAGALANMPQSVLLDVLTPISTRRMDDAAYKIDACNACFPAAADLIGNYITLQHSYTRLTRGAGESMRFWPMTHSYRAGLRGGADAALQTNGVMVRSGDVQAYVARVADSAWRRRTSSVLTSNLGSIDGGEGTPLGGETFRERTRNLYSIEHVWFVQPAHYAMPPFVTNVASCINGGLNALVAYPTAIVSHEHAQRYVDIVSHILHRVAGGGADTISFDAIFDQFAQRE